MDDVILPVPLPLPDMSGIKTTRILSIIAFRAEELEICVTARRKSTTLSIELTIPVLISALLILLAPFFGKFQQQVVFYA